MKPNLKNQIQTRSGEEMLRLLKANSERLGPAAVATIGASLLLLASWHSEEGRRIALWLFFFGCSCVVAYAFRLGSNSGVNTDRESAVRQWRARIRQVATILLFTWLCFSLICLLLTAPDRMVCMFLALGMLVPTLCIVPFYSLVTGRQFAAVVFTAFSVFAMKLLGCLVVVLVYGWDASDRGYTAMPWTHPNLLVSLFLFNTAVISAFTYCAGRKKFLSRYGATAPCAAKQESLVNMSL